MIAAALLSLLLSTQMPSATPLARWREALELDLPQAALAEMRTTLAPGGALRASGEARYLAAQLAFRSGEDKLLGWALEPAGLEASERPWQALARAWLALERDAFDECAKALELNERHEAPMAIAQRIESQILIGKLLDRQGLHVAARAPLERFVREAPLLPEAPSAWHALARGARASGDLERARACALAAQKSAQWHSYYRARRIQLREAPDDPLPRLGLAQLMVAASRDDQARLWLEELTTRWPEEARGWLEYARLESRAGASERAAVHYKRYRGLGGSESLEPAAGAGGASKGPK
jgi:hypothetical protein